MEHVVIATIHPWNIRNYRTWKAPRGFRKHLITRKEELTKSRLQRLKPRYIFFPHWSWMIPKEIYTSFECVVFHMTDLPFGRGGSPLQNLISRGIYTTKISALRVEEGLDTGPIYLKTDFDISEGSAHELYQKLSAKTFAMMSTILKERPEPKPQHGKAVVFARRTPEQSEITADIARDPRKLYDHIRMLDAPGYPRAFMMKKGKRLEFTHAKLNTKLRITIVIDNPMSWAVPYGRHLVEILKKQGHRSVLVHTTKKIPRGDIAYFIGCEKLVPAAIRARNRHNLVVHESALPKGKGWSPLTWHIIEGHNKIPVTLFEAEDRIDSGVIYAQTVLAFRGDELIDELRKQQGKATIDLLLRFLKKYPAPHGTPQRGKATFYTRRTPRDSELDINKSLREQFNLLRTVDNERYPAFFVYKKNTYGISIYKIKK